MIDYYSYRFSMAEDNYKARKKEVHAVLLAICSLRSYLDGKTFKFFTDYQALAYTLDLK